MLKQTYTILQNIIPIALLSDSKDTQSTVDKNGKSTLCICKYLSFCFSPREEGCEILPPCTNLPLHPGGHGDHGSHRRRVQSFPTGAGEAGGCSWNLERQTPPRTYSRDFQWPCSGGMRWPSWVVLVPVDFVLSFVFHYYELID